MSNSRLQCPCSTVCSTFRVSRALIILFKSVFKCKNLFLLSGNETWKLDPFKVHCPWTETYYIVTFCHYDYPPPCPPWIVLLAVQEGLLMCKLVSKVGTTHLIDSALLGRTDLPELDPSRDLLLIARAPLKTDIHTNTNTLTTIIITKAHKMITSHVYEELHFPKTI